MVVPEAIDLTEAAYISEKSVKAALDSLLYCSRVHLRSPLENLALVDEALMDTTLPRGPSSRSYVLSCLLTSMITDEFYRHRHAIERDMPSLETLQEQVTEIIESVKNTNSELTGWAWLYYHYVRVDLGVSATAFCRIVCIDQRTLRRYQRQAVRRIMFQLISREQTVRKVRHRRRLYAQLPSVRKLHLYGRGEAISRAVQLSDRLCGNPIQVVGASGVGKTAFVQETVRSLIDNASIDQVLWLDNPNSVQEIRQSLTSFLDRTGVCVSLREFLQCQRTAFVFDGVDTLSRQLNQVEELLCDLSPAIVYLLANQPLPTRSATEFIVLSELGESDARQLICSLLNNWHFPSLEPIVSEDTSYVWEQAGGNPRLIEQMVLELQLQRLPQIANA